MAEETNEKLYTIPLRDAFKKPKYSRLGVALRLIKDFVKTHSKVEEVKIGKHLNEKIWENGKVNIPRKVRVNVSKEVNTGFVELAGFEFEKVSVDEVEAGGMKDKLMNRLGGKAMQKQAEEELVEEGKAPTQEAVESEVEKELEESTGEKNKSEKEKSKDSKEKSESVSKNKDKTQEPKEKSEKPKEEGKKQKKEESEKEKSDDQAQKKEVNEKDKSQE